MNRHAHRHAATEAQKDQLLSRARSGNVTEIESILEELDTKGVDIAPLVGDALDRTYHDKKWAAVAYLAGYLADIAVGETSGGAAQISADAENILAFVSETGTDQDRTDNLTSFIVDTSAASSRPIIEFRYEDEMGVSLRQEDLKTSLNLAGGKWTDEIVIPEKQISVEIAFPLSVPHTFVLTAHNPGGFTIASLAEGISQLYSQIYKEEEKTSETSVSRIPGFSNRSRTDGKYGIWGYDIDDLVLLSVKFDGGRGVYIPQVLA